MPGEQRWPPVDRSQPELGACLVDALLEERPDLTEPHIDVRRVEAVEEHDRRDGERLGGGEAAGEVRVDDHDVGLQSRRGSPNVVAHRPSHHRRHHQRLRLQRHRLARSSRPRRRRRTRSRRPRLAAAPRTVGSAPRRGGRERRDRSAPGGGSRRMTEWDAATYDQVAAPMTTRGTELVDRLELRGDRDRARRGLRDGPGHRAAARAAAGRAGDRARRVGGDAPPLPRAARRRTRGVRARRPARAAARRAGRRDRLHLDAATGWSTTRRSSATCARR